MSDPIRVENRAEPWIDRIQPWFAGCISALLHLLMLLLLLYASKPTMTPPQGAASGGRVKVDFIGETSLPEQPTPAPPSPPSKPLKKPRAASRVQTTLVAQSDDPVPADTTTSTETPTPVRPSDEAAQRQAQAPAASPPPSTRRRSATWGRPPGLLDEDVSTDDEGLARNASNAQGNQHDINAAEPSLEVGGYQVYYDLRSEARLRAWMDKGIKELFLPLPGTQFYMVCQAQVALDRGSGKCRLLAPDSPEMPAIGDAREVIDMIQVYRQGELVWRGPGPYR